MTNDEYHAELESKIAELEQLRKEGIILSAGIIGQSFTEADMFFWSAADRCIRLIDGFIPLMKERNLTCGGVLLRMQMDNCMRTYAPFIAQDRDAVIHCIVTGAKIRDQKSVDNKNMTDGHLKDKITEIDHRFSTVYDNASGFVHFSEKAFYQTVDEISDNQIKINIGHPLPERRNEFLMECVSAYIHYVKLQYELLKLVAESKERFDKEHANEGV